MSDVPDWLVELAAQGNDDDREDEERDDDVFDFASSEPLVYSPEPESPEAMLEETPAPAAQAVQDPETDADLMDALRSQVEADELEEDMLDKAWGLEPESRLSCQALLDDEDLVVEIPRYTINMVSERH